MASCTVRIFSAASSGISRSKLSSSAMTSSTVSRESAPRSSTKEAPGVTSASSTPSCSEIICLTFSTSSFIFSFTAIRRPPPAESSVGTSSLIVLMNLCKGNAGGFRARSDFTAYPQPLRDSFSILIAGVEEGQRLSVEDRGARSAGGLCGVESENRFRSKSPGRRVSCEEVGRVTVRVGQSVTPAGAELGLLWFGEFLGDLFHDLGTKFSKNAVHDAGDVFRVGCTERGRRVLCSGGGRRFGFGPGRFDLVRFLLGKSRLCRGTSDEFADVFPVIDHSLCSSRNLGFRQGWSRFRGSNYGSFASSNRLRHLAPGHPEAGVRRHNFIVSILLFFTLDNRDFLG